MAEYGWTWLLPKPAEHVTRVTTVPAVVAPGEPVIKLGQFFVSCEIGFLIHFSCAW